MTEASSAPIESPSTAAPAKNVFERIVGVLFSPTETFQDIVRRPNVVAPLLLIVIMGYISTALIMPKMDFSSMREQQVEAMRKQNPNMSDSDIERMERIMTSSVKVMSWVFPLLFIFWYMIVAGVLLLAFRLMGGEGNFAQAFAITLYSWIPMVLLSILTTVIVFARGTFDPVTAATLVKSNPAFLVDMKANPVLFSLLSSIDLFVIWMLILLSIGFAVMSKLSKAKSAVIVFSLWIAMLVIKVGFAAIGAARMKS